MNPDELNTYIKLKYFPIAHTYEYLIKLPDIVIDEMYFYIGKNHSLSQKKDFKDLFIKEYLIYIAVNTALKLQIEKIILATLFNHYSENTHSIVE